MERALNIIFIYALFEITSTRQIRQIAGERKKQIVEQLIAGTTTKREVKNK